MPKRLIPDFQRSPRVKFDYCLTAACTARQVNSFGNLKRILCLEPTYFFFFFYSNYWEKEGRKLGREGAGMLSFVFFSEMLFIGEESEKEEEEE